MAVKKSKTQEKPKETCKDCRHSYDWHCVGADGQMIFCRCPHQQWCKFLKHDYCSNFKPRRPNA